MKMKPETPCSSKVNRELDETISLNDSTKFCGTQFLLFDTFTESRWRKTDGRDPETGRSPSLCLFTTAWLIFENFSSSLFGRKPRLFGLQEDREMQVSQTKNLKLNFDQKLQMPRKPPPGIGINYEIEMHKSKRVNF